MPVPRAARHVGGGHRAVVGSWDWAGIALVLFVAAVVASGGAAVFAILA